MRNPLAQMRVTSPYGWRRNPSTGQNAFHEGVDLAAAVGTPVYAPLAGTVHAVGGSAARVPGTPGLYLLLSIGSNVRVRFNHLAKRPTVSGKVTEGQQVALTGNTGGSTGPHLHFAVYVRDKGAWRSTDPLAWLASGANPSPSGGGSTDYWKDDDVPFIVYQGPDSQAAKKLGDPKTGKGIRSLTAAEGHALRATPGSAVFVSLNAAQWKEFLKTSG